jgi:hypothetical protein
MYEGGKLFKLLGGDVARNATQLVTPTCAFVAPWQD